MKKEEIEYIESNLNISLPNDYKKVLLNYPKSLIETEAEDFLLINDHEKIVSENIEARKNFSGRPLNNKSLIIGENGCGDFFLVLLSENSAVYSFYHDQNKFYTVANNIDEYIKKISSEQVEENWGNSNYESEDLRIDAKGKNTGKKRWKFC